ncbi:MAG: hypothetical protein Q8M88_01315 [Phenylobacterium sp.]|uniref:hypothetical protein n=1 Tax=Phenylobacterium sp. TaxID=1871053 RepID=UPI00273596C2|nr:hypothetical protein [Phenylobacterium sp.]MDP3173057.1 hypothetical protein [Phenylobacterium sp.]
MPPKPPLDCSSFQHIPLVTEDGSYDDLAKETVLLERMRERAESYVRAFPWAPPIKAMLLAFGASEILALYLVRFEHAIEDTGDEELWVLVGDLPAMYFVTDHAERPSLALAVYCELAENWADAVLSNGDLSQVYPVAEPTRDRANILLTTTTFIRAKIIPDLE